MTTVKLNISFIAVFFKQVFYFIYRFLISIKLAIVTLLLLGFLTAIGTFVEAKYNQELANKLVYHSFWMSFVMMLLAINLTMVLIDRWPWKLRQIPFILAHFGILTLMMGFMFTNQFGLDASLQFNEGESTSSINLSDMEIKVYASYDAEKFSLLYEQDVDMFFTKPSQDKPFKFQAGDQTFLVDKHIPFAIGQQIFKPALQGGNPVLRFHLSGSRANVVEWLELELGQKSLSQTYGPAVITLTVDEAYKATKKTELVLFVKGNRLFYSLGKGNKKNLKQGEMFSTGWMDFKFRLLEFYPKAQKEFVFTTKSKPSDKTVKAIRVSHEGRSTWLGQNSYVRFFKEDRVYALAYLNKTLNLNFNLKLLDFKIEHYQGSNKAKSYESEVQISGKDKFLISMNEPLKYAGWTFYQSSFTEPENPGASYRSILSVNRDPGRSLKYIGSAWIVLGIVLLFYRRKIYKYLKI